MQLRNVAVYLNRPNIDSQIDKCSSETWLSISIDQSQIVKQTNVAQKRGCLSQQTKHRQSNRQMQLRNMAVYLNRPIIDSQIDKCSSETWLSISIDQSQTCSSETWLYISIDHSQIDKQTNVAQKSSRYTYILIKYSLTHKTQWTLNTIMYRSQISAVKDR